MDHSIILREPWDGTIVKIYSKPLLIVHAFFCNLEQVVLLHSVLGVLLHNFCADDLAQHALSLAESCFAESRIAKSCISESYVPVSFMAGPAVCMRVLCMRVLRITQVHPESQTLHRALECLVQSINAFFQQAVQKRYQKDNMIHYITKSELINEQFDEKLQKHSHSGWSDAPGPVALPCVRRGVALIRWYDCPPTNSLPRIRMIARRNMIPIHLGIHWFLV